MIILDRQHTVKELKEINSFANGFVKGVVDLNQELVALDADMHYELADYLKEQRGSREIDMWGFNLWLDNQSMDEILEYIPLSIFITTSFMVFLVVEWEYWIRILWQKQRR